MFSSCSWTAASASSLLFSSCRDQVAFPLELGLRPPGPPWLRLFCLEAAGRSNAVRKAETFQGLSSEDTEPISQLLKKIIDINFLFSTSSLVYITIK